MNFALTYENWQREIGKAIRAARLAGRTIYQTSPSAREVDPTRLSEREIDMIALREAQRYTERAINIHNNGQ